MECRTDSDNECSGFAQSAESVYARLTSHSFAATDALLRCQSPNIVAVALRLPSRSSRLGLLARVFSLSIYMYVHTARGRSISS